MAKLQTRFFKEEGLNANNHTVHDVFIARLVSHKIGYRTAPLVGKYRDASIEHIFDLFLRFLRIEPTVEVIEKLIELELDYEKMNLALNKRLFKFVKVCHERGKKVFLITDMYLRSLHLEKLLRHFTGNDGKFYNKIYASCEFSAAKSTGILFQIFLKEEKLKPGEVLHIGDNPVSDILKCSECGIKTFYLPRPFTSRILTHIDFLIMNYKFRHCLI